MVGKGELQTWLRAQNGGGAITRKRWMRPTLVLSGRGNVGTIT